MTATNAHAHAHAPATESFEAQGQQSVDQAPMQLAASDAYKPGTPTSFRTDCRSGQNEHMGDDKFQDFLDNNLSPHDLFRSCSERTNGGPSGDTHKNVIEPPEAQCHPGSGTSDRGSDNSAPRDRNSDNSDNRSDNTLPRDRTDGSGDNTGYSRDHCHNPRDTHEPGDTTDVPGTRTPGENPSDRVVIEPCKDMPKPQLNPGEFLVIVINVSSDQLSRAGDFIGRLLNSAFNRDSSNGSSDGGSTDGGNGFHLGGIPSPSDVLGSLFGGHDGGRDGSGLPGPGDLLGGLPGIGELFGGGDDSQSGSGHGIPSPGDILGSLPGPGDILGSLPGMGGGRNGGSGMPNPGDLLSSLPGPGDILGNLPGMGGGRNGGSGMPNPGDLLSSLPGPGDILGNLPGMGGGRNGGSGMPNPGDLLGSLPGPGDILGNLPGMGGGDSGSGGLFGNLPGLGSFGGGEGGGSMNPGDFFNSMPSPGDLFSSLPNPGDIMPGLPGLGGGGGLPTPDDIIEDTVTKPLKSIKNFFKKIF